MISFPQNARIKLEGDNPTIEDMQNFIDYGLSKAKYDVIQLPTLMTTKAYDWPLCCTLLSKGTEREESVFVVLCYSREVSQYAALSVICKRGVWRVGMYSPGEKQEEYLIFLNELRRAIAHVTNFSYDPDRLFADTEKRIPHGQVFITSDGWNRTKLQVIAWIWSVAYYRSLAFAVDKPVSMRDFFEVR
jgi:hypothetical protein